MKRTTMVGGGGLVIVATAAMLALPAHGAGPVDGGQLYQENCAACHQPNGEGLPGAFPTLAGDAFVKSDPAQVAHLVINGRNGMPSFKDSLTDAQLAAILTHVRASWGNKAAPIGPEVLAAARAGKAAH